MCVSLVTLQQANKQVKQAKQATTTTMSDFDDWTIQEIDGFMAKYELFGGSLDEYNEAGAVLEKKRGLLKAQYKSVKADPCVHVWFECTCFGDALR